MNTSGESSADRPAPREARSVLVVRIGRVGDMVLATPGLRAVFERHPEAEVHLLTSPEAAHVLRGFHPRLTEILIYRRKGLGQKLRRRWIRRKLEARAYDVAYGFERRETYRRFVAGLGERTFALNPDGGGRICEEAVELVRGEPIGPEEWVSLPVREDARWRARELLRGGGIDDSAIVVGLHPSFAGLRKAKVRQRGIAQRKLWPLESWAELARRLVAWGRGLDRPLAVMTDLLPEDRDIAGELERASGGAVRAFVEPPDFERYKAMLERMDALVTPDTGPMHVAAAVGTRVVALFPEAGETAYEPHADPERYTLVRPAAEAGSGVAGIEAGAVFAEVEAHLGRQGVLSGGQDRSPVSREQG